MSKSGAKGKLFRGPLALAGNRGFQPQRKPPVHTGGFIFFWIAQEITNKLKRTVLQNGRQ